MSASASRLSPEAMQARAAAEPMDDGTILALGLRFRVETDKFDALDRQFVRLPDGHQEKLPTARYAHRADARRRRLFAAVFQRRPETLADAVVLAAHGLHQVEAMFSADQEEMVATDRLSEFLGRLSRAFAGIVIVTAREAGLDTSQIGYPTLGRSLKRFAAGRA